MQRDAHEANEKARAEAAVEDVIPDRLAVLHKDEVTLTPMPPATATPGASSIASCSPYPTNDEEEIAVEQQQLFE